MTVARASQVVAEVLRTNTAVAARGSQVVAEVVRANTAAKAQASQVTVEVLRVKLPAALASQVVVELLTAERTLSASFSSGLSMQADLVPGSAISATGNIALSSSARLELGAEFSSAAMPVAVTGSAALQAEARLGASLNVSVNEGAQLREGVEFNAFCTIPVILRAGLKVYPEPVTGFFLLF